MNDRIGLAETARLLAVSTATVRNWMKAGRLPYERVGRSPAFARADVEALRRALAAGEGRRLRSRRNKTAASGKAVPAGYVRSRSYAALAAEVAGIAGDMLPPRLALHELALMLAVSRGHIRLPEGAGEAAAEASFTERLLAGRLDAGGFAPLLRELRGGTNSGARGEAHGGAHGGPAEGAHGAARSGPDAHGGEACAPLADPGIRRRLRAIARLPLAFAEGDDLLGLVHMALARLGRRKRSGAYYTPSAVAGTLAEEALRDWPAGGVLPVVLDPCCGSGNFLIRVYLLLKRRLRDAGLTPAEADRALQAQLPLAGFDIDGAAVALAKLNLALLAEPGASAAVPAWPIRVCDTLRACAEPSDGGAAAIRCDIVIGNPPWGYDFPPEDAARYKRRFRTAARAAPESYALFVEAGLKLLKDDGLLAYVLPESLLHVKAHAETRKLLAESTALERIRLAGSPFAGVHSPAITLTARKRPPAADHVVAVVEDGGREVRQREVPQRRFRGNDGHAFNVTASDAEQALLERMRRMPGVWRLEGRCEFALGIVTGDNDAYVLPGSAEGAEPVLKGSDVFKYSVCPGRQSILFVPERFQQVAPERLYRAPEKLIYRFIGGALVFAYDDRQTLTLNSANVLVPRVPGYAVKYILAVLNARPAQFYHTFAHASVKTLRSHIEALPIPDCPADEQARIAALADRLIASRDPAERRRLYEAIDERVMARYGFDAAARALVLAHCGEPRWLTPPADQDRVR